MHSQRFFKTSKGEYGEGDRFLGIRVPVLRKLTRQIDDVEIDVAGELLESRFHEERLLALLMLVRLFERGDDSTRRSIYRYYLNATDFINNWDLVDSSAPQIVGGWLDTRSRKPLYRLVKSRSLWERRIAILATLYFIRQKDFEDVMALSEQVLFDKEDLIHKASGWMLREAGNRERDVLLGFLDQHATAMPRTMLRYAIEKLPASLKNTT